MPPKNRQLTIEEAAKQLNISKGALYKRILRGAGPECVLHHGMKRIYQFDLDEWRKDVDLKSPRRSSDLLEPVGAEESLITIIREARNGVIKPYFVAYFSQLVDDRYKKEDRTKFFIERKGSALVWMIYPKEFAPHYAKGPYPGLDYDFNQQEGRVGLNRGAKLHTEHTRAIGNLGIGTKIKSSVSIDPRGVMTLTPKDASGVIYDPPLNVVRIGKSSSQMTILEKFDAILEKLHAIDDLRRDIVRLLGNQLSADDIKLIEDLDRYNSKKN